MILSSYEDMYRGKTIVIVGCGYSINNLSEYDMSLINACCSIGTNQSYIKIKSNYYMSGHFHHTAMQHKFGNGDMCFFQGEPHNFFDSDEYSDVTTLTNINVVGDYGWLPKITDSNFKLVGAEQIAFSATHMAYILGAKRIVYVGFDFSAQGHFYNNNDVLLDILKENSKYLMDNYYGINSFINEDIDDFFRLNFDANININKFRNSTDIINKFKYYIDTLKRNDIEVYSIHDNVLIDIGATKINIEDII